MELNVPLLIRSAISVVVILCAYYLWRRPKNSPPGPRGLPVLGVAPFLGRHPERVFWEWSKKYGPIMSARIGLKDYVILSDYESINEALAKNKDMFSDRPSNPYFDIVGGKGYGLVTLSYRSLFKRERKFGITTLRGFGVGKKSMETRILEELDYLKEAIQETDGKPFDIKNNVTNAISNNICSIVFGKRYDYSDVEFQRMIYYICKGVTDPKDGLVAIIMTIVPFLKHIPPFSWSLKRMENAMAKTHEKIGKIIEEHRTTLDMENPRDFIDAYIIAAEKEQGHQFSAKQLSYFCHDLFFAGTDTTSSTIRWAIITMLHYPESQKKLREEIVSVIGTASLPTMSHRPQMPYTNAFIEELYRFRTLVPLAVPHKTAGDVTLGGYEIMKDTTVFTNLWAVHNNPAVWQNPEKFDPHRHIDENGQFVSSKHVIAFNLGPRHCIGELLARMEVFLFLVFLVQKFEFLPPPEGLPNINDGLSGFLYIPLPFNVIAKEV